MAIIPGPKSRYEVFPQLIMEIFNPITGEYVALETPAHCQDAEDLEWLIRTWQELFALDWKIAYGKGY